MEKFLNIVCRVGGLVPSAVVVVATVRALKHHGGEPEGGLAAIERGSANLRRHLEIVSSFGLPAVVAINVFDGDSEQELEAVRRLALELGAHAVGAQRRLRARRRGRGGARGGGRRRRGAAERVRHDVPARGDDPGEDRGDRDARSTARRASTSCSRPRSASRASRRTASTGCRSAWRRRTSRSRTTRRFSTHRRASPSTSATSARTRAPGWLVPLCGEVMTMPGPRRAGGGVRGGHRRARPHRWPLLIRCGRRSARFWTTSPPRPRLPAPARSRRSRSRSRRRSSRWPPASPAPGRFRGSPRSRAGGSARGSRRSRRPTPRPTRTFLAARRRGTDDAGRRSRTVAVPLEVAECAAEVAALAASLAEHGNPNLRGEAVGRGGGGERRRGDRSRRWSSSTSAGGRTSVSTGRAGMRPRPRSLRERAASAD